jgi:hypothetical protein
LPTATLATLQEPFSRQILSNEQDDFEREISGNPLVKLFAWTLTHPSRAFSEIEPVFNSRRDFVDFVKSSVSRSNREISLISAEIVQTALEKIDREWKAWVDVHDELKVDERKLDNMLMAAVYRIIIDRDMKMCVLCKSPSDLTIHHIIQKRRNVLRVTPPFGRSVPTNLITLCRSCHANYDPIILA